VRSGLNFVYRPFGGVALSAARLELHAPPRSRAGQLCHPRKTGGIRRAIHSEHRKGRLARPLRSGGKLQTATILNSAYGREKAVRFEKIYSAPVPVYEGVGARSNLVLRQGARPLREPVAVREGTRMTPESDTPHEP
jgi:hypothetical protein